MSLAELFAPLIASPCTAFVGAGGKTTAMFACARASKHGAWLTTSTKLGLEQQCLAEETVFVGEKDFDALAFNSRTRLFVRRSDLQKGRLLGLYEGQIVSLQNQAFAQGLPLLIEADGSACKPLKAPGADEPVIATCVSRVVLLLGLRALDKPLDEERVFRAKVFSSLSGLSLGAPITMEAICRFLVHHEGGHKGVLPGVALEAWFNQADERRLTVDEISIARECLAGAYARVWQLSLQGGWAERIL